MLETIVAIYQPAIPRTPLVSAEGFKAALALFPATRRAPDLAGIELPPTLSPPSLPQRLKSLECQPAATTTP